MKKYSAPKYTGFATINELIALSRRKGNDWKRTGAAMSFNMDGYAFIPKTARSQRLLVIDKSEQGNLEAYVWHYGSYRKLIDYTDSDRAKAIINDLYTNPYYHSTGYYTGKIDRLVKALDLTSFSNTEELKKHFEYLHERGSFYLEQIQRGINTFGCAHRFITISHTPYKLLNYLLVNFEGKGYKYTHKTPITYEGSDWDGSEQLHYKLVDFDYSKVYLDDGIFIGFEMVNGHHQLIETIMFDGLWDDIITAPGNTSEYIRVINQTVNYRGLFPNKEYLDNYVNQLNAVIDEPNLLREKFYELFKQLFIDINLVAPVKERN